MSAVQQTSSTGLWSSLFADKTKAYKPVTFRPGDKLPQTDSSSASRTITAPSFTTDSSSQLTNGTSLLLPAAETQSNGSTAMWKPSSLTSAKNTSSTADEPWRAPISVGQPFKQFASKTPPKQTTDDVSVNVSSSFQWVPTTSEPSTTRTDNSSQKMTVKSICKQWPPKQQSIEESTPSKPDVMATASDNEDVVNKFNRNESKDEVSGFDRSEPTFGKIQTTNKVPNDGLSGSRSSSVMKDIENCLTDEWWDSLFASYTTDKSDVKQEKPTTKPVEVSTRYDDFLTNGLPPNSTATNQNTSSVNSTAAVLRLSNALQRAPAETTQSASGNVDYSSPSRARKVPPPTPPKDRRKMEESAILQEWKAGLKDDYNSPSSSSSNGIRYPPLHYAAGPETQLAKDVGSSQSQPQDAGNQTNGPKPVKFEGIGPTESVTGVPIATRTSIDEANRKDWYKCMYKSLHKVERPQEVNPFLTAYVLTEPNSPTNKEGDFNSLGSPNSAIFCSSSLGNDGNQFSYSPHARYRPQKYKNQPKRIEDYEPGNSSLAERQAKTCESERLLASVRCTESDADADYRSASESGDVISGSRNKRNTRKQARKVDGLTFRQQWDQENRRRREEIDRIIEAERQKRFINEKKAYEANKHSDFMSPMEKRKILLNRYEDDVNLQTADSLQRPSYKSATRVRGKAKALYTFRAQHNRELSLKKGDTVYLLRQVDRNWFKGERHGAVGIFPISYVEVLTSIEEAQVAAGLREGRAWAKYNFKGQTAKELSFKKGDIIKLVRRIDDDWYEARVDGRQGIVPVIYIELAKEPETPLATPMSSRANTPVLGNSTYLSPASSMVSLNGADLPSRPVSPWTDFYESEVEVDRELAKSPRNTSRTNSLQRTKNSSDNAAKTDPNTSSTPNHMYYRSQNILGNGPPYVWPTSQASTLNRSEKSAAQSDSSPRDLFDLAQRRRQIQNNSHRLETDILNPDADWRARSRSLPRTKTTTDAELGKGSTSKIPNDSKTLRAKSSSPLTVKPLQQPKQQQQQQQQQQRRIDMSSPTPRFQRYRAVYAYKPRHIDELEIREGDIIEVMETCDDGWFVGTSLRTNEFGTFPGNYVRLTE